MNEQGLKALENLGAELGAAKAEVERLREALRKIIERCELFINDEADMRTHSIEALMGIAEDALAKQAEPTDTFTAVDMATAAAQGFRDGQAAVEPAPAQDERKTFEVEIPDISAIYDGRSFIPYRSLEAGERLMTVAQHLRIEKQLRAALTRPAQAEQQPFGWVTEDYLTDKSATTYSPEVADRWRAKGWPVREIYAAPIANAAPQPVAMVDANDDGMWADILPDVTVKVGQMLYAAPIAQTVPRCQCCGYLVTDSEHRGCLRAAAPQPEQGKTVLVPVSVIEEAAHMLEAHSPGSGSVESFTAQDLRAALSAKGAGDAGA